MKLIQIITLLFLCTSCAIEDDYVPLNIEPIFVDNPETTIKIDIIYVLPSGNNNKSMYHLNENDFVDNLNGGFFHRYDIGLELGQIRTITNDELYDLRDNRDAETSTFLKETQDSYKKDRVNVYIIKRANTIALAGIGNDKRALITDEFLYETTAPHEIGHALGLFHTAEEGNIMSQINPHKRTFFSDTQVLKMKNHIHKTKEQ
ncbi:matrixin family metalloprotease [Aquimarina pacifica]|uniref:matrixin family metalloprotease n=1 Tax=Aquimarina pacifica TaxID=1296415 RepID=UPI00046EFA06|nr:matrixin family metalloprotease [Aquimarina pacifica]